MTFRRLAVAAAIFLIVTYLKLFLPVYEQRVEPRLWAVMDRESFALRLPEETVSWLGLD